MGRVGESFGEGCRDYGLQALGKILELGEKDHTKTEFERTVKLKEFCIMLSVRNFLLTPIVY